MEDTARAVIRAIYKAVLFEEPSGAEPDVKRVMDSKKVTDHHAVIPTMEIAATDLSSVPEGEMKILRCDVSQVHSRPAEALSVHGGYR